MKKYIAYLLMLAVAMQFAACTGGTAQEEKTVVEKHGFLSVKDGFLTDEQGEKLVLKGVSYGWHNWWPRFYNASTVNTFAKDWNATLVRAAMGVEPEGAYIDTPKLAIDCVTAVADAAIAEGIYVIIDWHSHGIKTEEAKAFFTQMATRYKDVPNVIYEIFNEPVHDSWADVKAYSEEVIAAIRAIDTRNVILVGSPHWDQDIHIAADDPITGYTNLMYALHFYAATHNQGLRDKADYALSKGLPLFVSECAAMEASGDGPIDPEEWNAWVQWMDKNHLSWAAWSVADKNETCSMFFPKSASEGAWPDEDIKEWGLLVKKELSKEITGKE